MKKWLGFALTALASALVAYAALRGAALARRRQAPVTVHFLSMGTIAEVTVIGGDAERAAEIVRAAFNEVEAAASVFRPDSPVARLNASGSVRLPPVMPGNFDLAALLRRSLDVARATDGAFDPTVNPLMRLWGFRQDGIPARQPSDADIASALGRVGWTNVVLSAVPGSDVIRAGVEGHPDVELELGGIATEATDVSFGREGMELDLGGIAKGAAVDFAYERLHMADFTDFLINLGGNIRVSGRPERGRDNWRVAIRDPANPSRTTGETVVLGSGQAVATSGSYERYVEIGGRRFSHIVDPRTGHPVARQGSVSVIANTAEEADAYSTAFFVMGLGSEDGGATVFRWLGASLTEHVREAR